MKSATLFACLCLAAPATLALAQDDGHAHGSDTQQADEPVNAMCPVGKEAIVPSAGTVEHKGETIGLCCPGCGKQFQAWDEARKDSFVELAMAETEPGVDGLSMHGGKTHRNTDAPPTGDEGAVDAQLMHYPIDTCIVAGGELGSMGEPVNYMHEGRLVRFCCAMCTPTFESKPRTFLDALDEKIVEAQRGPYPLETCVVSGEALGSMGEPIEYVHNNRLVRLCCAMCESSIEKNPGEYMETLDEAYADAQRESYPLNTCVVSGEELGSMGEPVELVAGNTLVRLCCEGCLPEFRSNPSKYLTKIESE